MKQNQKQQIAREMPVRQKPKKSMAMRIIVLIMAFAMFAGFIILPLLQNA